MYKCCQSGLKIFKNFFHKFSKFFLTLFKGTARDFKDVKVYVSDPWYEAADNAHVLSWDFYLLCLN